MSVNPIVTSRLSSLTPAYTAKGAGVFNITDVSGIHTIHVASGTQLKLLNSKGDNILYLQGQASDYNIKVKGRTTTLTDHSGHSIVLGVNQYAQALSFLDGSATLKRNGKLAMLGDQTLTNKLQSITATLDETNTSEGKFDLKYLTLPTGSNTVIKDGLVADGYNIMLGAKLKIIQIRGENLFNLAGSSQDYQAKVTGKTITLIDDQGGKISFNLGSTLQKIIFSDGSLELSRLGKVTSLGNQILNKTFADITATLNPNVTSDETFGIVPPSPLIALAEDTGTNSSDALSKIGTLNVTGILPGVTWEYSIDQGNQWLAGSGSSFTISGDGNHSVLVRQKDLPGNLSESVSFNFTLDTTASTPTVTHQTTNTISPIINGTALLAADETLSITVNGATYDNLQVTAGNWSLNTATATPNIGSLGNFTDGQTYSVIAFVTDAAGNIGSDISSNEIRIDTTPPATPTVTSQTTSSTAPIVTGSATLAFGETLSVTVNGATYNNLAVTEDGQWSLDTATATPNSGVLGRFIDGQYFSVTAIITDGAGNTSSDIGNNELLVIPQTANIPTLSGLNGSNGFRLAGEAADDFSGLSVSNAGDVNGDGYADLLVGAFGADPYGNSFSGVSYVVFGQSTGFSASLNLADLNGNNGFRLAGAAENDLSGSSVSNAGDVNGDGYADLLVGANGADPNGSSSGASYVVFGQASGFSAKTNLSDLNINGSYGYGFRLVGVHQADRSGSSVSDAGDVNGDGYADLLVGAYGASTNGFRAGAGYVIFGQSTNFAPDFNLAELNGSNGFSISGVAANDYSGRSVSSAGDVNGDGYTDFLVGAPEADPNDILRSGASYVVFGQSTGFSANLNLADLNGSNGFRLAGAPDGHFSGRAVSNAGDFNGDGYADLLVGAYGANTNGIHSGASYVVFGKSTGFAASLNLADLNGSNGFRLAGTAANDRSGFSVSSAGDINGDGYTDLLVGAFGADANVTDSGASYVVFGKSTGFAANLNLADLNGSNGFRLAGAAANDRSGYSVSSAGDVNGDGYADLLVGAPNADPNGINSGTSYVVFGGNFSGTVTHQGSPADDVLTGSASAERMLGGIGHDTLIGGGGADVLYGGAGDDVFRIADLDFLRLDGGSGHDTLALSGSGFNLDLANHRSFIQGMERIDLSGSGNNTLIVSALDLLNLSDTSNTLSVDGNAGDQVLIVGSDWTDGGIAEGYHSYTQGAAFLKVAVALDTQFRELPTVNRQITNNIAPIVTGSASLADGETLSVTVNGATYNKVAVTNGQWSLNTGTVTPSSGSLAAFVDGQHYAVTATVTDAAGNTRTDTSTDEILIDTTPPTIPTVNSQITNNIHPVVTGNATLAADETLSVTINGATYHHVAVTNGQWSLNTATATPSSGSLAAFVDGQYAVTATVADATGNTRADTSTNEILIDTTPPAVPTVNSQTTNSTKPIVTGSATLAAGETLNVTLNGATYNNIAVANGQWSLNTGTTTPNSGNLAAFVDGKRYAVTATVADAAGNTRADTSTNEILIDTTPPSVPTVNSLTTNSNHPIITGSATLAAGETLNVTLNGATYNNIAVANGQWSLNTGTATPSNGSLAFFVDGQHYDVTATVTDAAGNTRADTSANEILIDTTPPATPTVTSQITSSATPIVTGSAILADGETLSVIVNGATYQNIAVMNGQWSLNTGIVPPSSGSLEAFVDGQHYAVTATVMDAAGNTRTDTSTDEILIVIPPRINIPTLSGLDGSNGFRLTGEHADDFSGISVSSAGDVNGDGYDDLLVGAFHADANGSNSGASYVVFGQATGFAASINLADLNGSNGFRLMGAAANDRSGRSVSSAGDVNGDGYADLLVGADSADPNGNYSGASYVVFGKSTGFSANLNLAELNGSNGFRLVGAAVGDFSGGSVSNAGDVNGDGYTDLLVGAYNADPNGSDSGASYVVFGKSTDFAASVNLADLNGSNGFRLTGVAPNDRSGISVSSAGDVNGDGYADLLIGADHADPNGSNSGASYVVFGQSTGFSASLNLADLNGSNGFRLAGVAAGDYSGHSVNSAGDVNGDGYADLLVGAYSANPNGSGSGASYVVFGKSTDFAASVNLADLNGSNGFRLAGVAGGDFSGISVSSAGDVNGDGYADLLVGADNADPNFSSSGASYVLFGKSAGFAASLNLANLNGNNGFRLAGVAGGDFSGHSVSSAGDVNGDGYSDLLVGAFGADPNGITSGASYVVFGGNFSGTVTHQGSTADDIMYGSTSAEHMLGGIGNDTLVSGGGADVLYGGAGDDILRIADLDFLRLDGGSGHDTLALSGSDLTLNLAAYRSLINDIERIDLSGSGNNSLNVSALDLLNLSDTFNTLIVEGNADDNITGLDNSGWLYEGIQDDYRTYTHDAAILLVGVAVTTDYNE